MEGVVAPKASEGEVVRQVWEEACRPCGTCYGSREVPKQAYTAAGEPIPFAVFEGDYVIYKPCPDCTE